MGSLIFGVGRLHRLSSGRQRDRLLRNALDLGFRDFDVAPSYGNGLNELELGRALGAFQNDCRITTKFGIPVDLYGERHPSLFLVLRGARSLMDPRYASEYTRRTFSPAEMQKSLEGSLRRLHRDYVDDFLIHEPLGPLRKEEIELLNAKAESLRQQGKIRRWGVCGPLASMGSLIGDSEIDVIQFPLADLAATAHASGKRRIAYGVHRHYAKVRRYEGFQSFLGEVLAREKGLDLIVSTTSVKKLGEFKGFW